MRIILYLLQKEFTQVMRNRTMLPLIFVVPVVQMLVLVYAANFEMRRTRIQIIDNDKSALSFQLISSFEGNDFFETNLGALSLFEAENLLLKGKTDAVMVIPEQFDRKITRGEQPELQLLIDAIDGNKAQLIAAYSEQLVMNFNQKVATSVNGTALSGTPFRIDVNERHWYNSRLDYKWFMAPGILAILVTVIGMFLSGLNLVREKEIGTIEQINVTPVRKYQFIVAKLIPFWLIALFDLAFGLAIAHLVYDLPVEGSFMVLFGIAGIYLIGMLGLGLLLSTWAETQQQMLFLTFFFMLVFILMGGIFTPVESMPEWAQQINRINPVYYFIRVLRMVVLKGSGFADLRMEWMSLTVLSMLFLGLAINRYRKTI